MSKVAIKGNPLGTGTFTIEAPNSNTDSTVLLPVGSGSVVLTDATQTLTNKTLTSPTISGATLSSTTTVGSAWTFAQSGTDLVFSYNGTPVMKITSAGAIVAKDNITAYGTV